MQLFQYHGFIEPAYPVQGRASIADLFPTGNRCGIYILHFENGEYYVGQAVDVTRRFVQHRNNHNDIMAISFQKVIPERLNIIERNVIESFEINGIVLRNIVFASLPHADSDFDLIMSEQEQQDWLSNTNEQSHGIRPVDDSLRNKYHRRFFLFESSEYYTRVVEILRLYARSCLPIPHKSEISFWAISCLPGANVLARINIFWQEVLTIYKWNNDLWVSMHIAESPFHDDNTGYLAKLRRYSSIQITDHRYIPGGGDQINIEIRADLLAEIMNTFPIVSSAKLMNLRLMKKGPCNFGRNHCMDLADRILL